MVVEDPKHGVRPACEELRGDDQYRFIGRWAVNQEQIGILSNASRPNVTEKGGGITGGAEFLARYGRN
jgi:hypothetical protein